MAASEFQDHISLSTFAPESFNNNQIDFIFSTNSLNNDSDRDSTGSDSVSAVDDDNNDGFRTPTSSDYKIPVVRQCPPAPRRPKPISWSSSSRTSQRASSVRRGFRLYISDEIVVESIFSSDFMHQKNKKARKNENNGGE